MIVKVDRELYTLITGTGLVDLLWYREEMPRPSGPPEPFPSTAWGVRAEVPARFPLTIFHRDTCEPGRVSTKFTLVLRERPETSLDCILDGECKIISYNVREHYWYRDSYRYEMSIAAQGPMELILMGSWEKGAWDLDKPRYWFQVAEMHIIRRFPNGKLPREAVAVYRGFERSYSRIEHDCTLEAEDDGTSGTVSRGVQNGGRRHA